MKPGEPIVPDLQIFVSQEAGDPRTLSFRASAGDPRLAFGTFVDYGQTVLRLDPVRYLDGLFAQLQVAGTDVAARLEDAGVRLFEDLLPFELRRRLWQSRHEIRSLFVVTAEAWIPWELLKLQDPEGDGIGPFFAEAFALGRWLAASGQRGSAALHLPLRRLGLIFPRDSGLPQAKVEKKEMLAHAGDGREVVEIPAERQEIAAAMAAGEYDGWHFCGHGQAVEGEAEPWYLQIEADSFDSNQLHGRARRLGLRHPLVFVNACHGGRAGEGLAALGGLPASFLQVGAGAFIGPLWQVSDEGAALFARVFYRAFLGGATLGAAIREARQELRRSDPDDPTWLAYIVLGHPSALCRPAEGAPSPAAVTTAAQPAGVASGGGAAPAARVAAGSPSRSRSAKRPIPWLWRLALLLLALPALAGAALIRVPTEVRIEGRSSRLSAVPRSAAVSLLGQSAPFTGLTAAQLAAAEVVPAAAAAPVPLALPLDKTVGIVLADRLAPIREAGSMPRIDLAPGQPIAVQAERYARGLALRIEGELAKPPYEVILPQSALLRSSEGLISGFRGDWRLLRIFPGREGLLLEADIAAGSGEEERLRLLERPAELKELAFAEQSSLDGQLQSTLRELRITFSPGSGREPLQLGADAVLQLGREDRFRLTLLEVDGASGDLHFAAEGRTSLLRAGTSGNLRDLRLSLLEAGRGELLGLLAAAALGAVAFGLRRLVLVQPPLPARGGKAGA